MKIWCISKVASKSVLGCFWISYYLYVDLSEAVCGFVKGCLWICLRLYVDLSYTACCMWIFTESASRSICWEAACFVKLSETACGFAKEAECGSIQNLKEDLSEDEFWFGKKVKVDLSEAAIGFVKSFICICQKLYVCWSHSSCVFATPSCVFVTILTQICMHIYVVLSPTSWRFSPPVWGFHIFIFICRGLYKGLSPSSCMFVFPFMHWTIPLRRFVIIFMWIFYKLHADLSLALCGFVTCFRDICLSPISGESVTRLYVFVIRFILGKGKKEKANYPLLVDKGGGVLAGG